jgi:hypothetical protein
MAATNLGRLLRWYPPVWRDRYGEEFLVFMQDSFGAEKPPLAARLSIVAGGLRERARRSGLTGDSVPPADRVRAGVMTVLVSWTAMVVAGASFAKMAEHFDTALPDGAGAHGLPDLSYTFIQTVAGVAGLIVIAGAGLVLPAFMGYLRSGGWPSIRAHALRAAGCTLLTAGMTVPLLVWAHHLSAHQRNGGSTGYGVLFLLWAALVVATLVLWTVLAVVAASKVTFSRSLLAVEAGMAVAVTLAVVAILAATSLWWALIAERAPTFLSGDLASALNARLAATVLLMAVAAAAAMAGTVRIAQSLPEWRRN